MKKRSFIPHAPAAVTLSLLNLFATGELMAQDPSGFTSVAKWTLNDTPLSTTVVNEYAANFDGVITVGASSGVVDATRTASDTPGGSSGAGAAISFVGGMNTSDGNQTHNSVIEPASGMDASFIDKDGSTGSGQNGVNYDFYEGSRTVSAWVKFGSDDLAVGESRVVFYHGHPVYNWPGIDRICQLNDSVQTDLPGTVVTAHACRGFALGVYRASSTAAHFYFGNTNGDFSNHNAAFLLQTGSYGCDANLLNSTNVGRWHHVVGVFSLDQMSEGEESTHIYIDGVKCGSGKIAHPYTDVTPNSSTFRIGSGADILDNSDPDQHIFSINPFDGMIDDVRVYKRVLGLPAVIWLFNNSGRSGN